MSFAIGMDIGGTKIASALFDNVGNEVKRLIQPTPGDYAAILNICSQMLGELTQLSGEQPTIGLGLPGVIDASTGDIILIPNVPCLGGQNLRRDLEKICGRPTPIANDAGCAALSEAMDGAGAGHKNVFGLIMGTGVGGGVVIDGKLYHGAHGMAGEIGHVPLPFRTEADGPLEPCGCGQHGCIDKTIRGPALLRFWRWSKGNEVPVMEIAERARHGDTDAVELLDRFYTIVAKAMTTIIHTYDPDIIVVSGGLNNLPGLYEAVPKYWDRFAMGSHRRTRFVPAMHGALSGLRGAAWLGRNH